MDEILLNEVTRALETQNARLQKQEEEMQRIREASISLFGLKDEIKDLKSKLDHTGPVISQVQRNVVQFQLEVAGYKKELSRLHPIVHHHHIPKTAFIIVFLIIIMGGLSAGWWNAWRHGLSYRNADTQVKYMGLLGDIKLHAVLELTDSLVRSNPEEFRDSVLRIQDIRLQYRETMDKADKLKQQGYGK